jgi:group I intron endonuclease
MMDVKGCLYALTFPNGKQYIGITSGTLRRRVNLHRSHANTGRPGAVYNAIRKYGTRGFDAKVLVIASDWDYLCNLEQKAIAAFGTMAPGGFNLTLGGEGRQGYTYSEAERVAMSEARKGKGMGPRPHAKGWSHDDATKRKISEAGKGRHFSDKTRAKIGAMKIGNINRLGQEVSAETREKIANAQRGRIFTEEHRLNLSIAARNRKK